MSRRPYVKDAGFYLENTTDAETARTASATTSAERFVAFNNVMNDSILGQSCRIGTMRKSGTLKNIFF